MDNCYISLYLKFEKTKFIHTEAETVSIYHYHYHYHGHYYYYCYFYCIYYCYYY